MLTIAKITCRSVLAFILTAGLRADNSLLCELCFCMDPELVLLAKLLLPSELLVVRLTREGCLTNSGGCSVAATLLAL